MIAGMKVPEETAELERLASEASRNALAAQAEALRDLRARAGTLLAATSFTTPFLGSQAIEREGLGGAAWTALAAFVLALAATLYVLKPRDGLVVAPDGPEIYEGLWGAREDPAVLHVRLAHWFAYLHRTNYLALYRLEAGYRIASYALVTQVVLWVVHLAAIM